MPRPPRGRPRPLSRLIATPPGPQTLLVASYPPGAYYKRHLDSYDGVDIPRLITVLIYFGWEPQRGGQLRAHVPDHSAAADAGKHRDIDPLPGRLTVFYAQEVSYLTLPCSGGRPGTALPPPARRPAARPPAPPSPRTPPSPSHTGRARGPRLRGRALRADAVDLGCEEGRRGPLTKSAIYWRAPLWLLGSVQSVRRGYQNRMVACD